MDRGGVDSTRISQSHTKRPLDDDEEGMVEIRDWEEEFDQEAEEELRDVGNPSRVDNTHIDDRIQAPDAYLRQSSDRRPPTNGLAGKMAGAGRNDTRQRQLLDPLYFIPQKKMDIKYRYQKLGFHLVRFVRASVLCA